MPAEPPNRRDTPDKPTEDHQKSTEQRISELEAALAERISELEAALAASRAAGPLNPIPLHGAGEGTEIAETWSLYDQQRAQAEL